MGWWRYNVFKGEPKDGDTAALRLHQDNKTAEYYKSGKFWYTPATAKDGQPLLLVSSKDTTEISEKYIKTAAPKPPELFITGRYESGKSGDKSYYRFTTDAKYTDGKDAKLKKVHEQVTKDKDFERAVRACLGMADPKLVEFDKRVLGLLKVSHVNWVVASWDMARTLPLQGKEQPKRSNGTTGKVDLPGSWVEDEKKVKRFVLPNGLALPDKLPLEVTVYGDIVASAEGDKLAAELREPAVDALVDLMDGLKTALVKVDADSVKETTPGKPKSLAAAEAAFDDFAKKYEAAAIEGVSKRYFEKARDHVDLKLYKLDTKIALAKKSVMLALSVVATGVSPFTFGATAVLGIIGMVKSAAELGRDIYMFKRGVAGLEKELGKDLARTYGRYVLEPDARVRTGFEEVGKAFLEKLPLLGIVVNDVVKVEGTKTVEALEKNWSAYRPKVTETFVSLQKQLALIEPAIEKARAEAKKVDTPEFRAWEASNPEAKAAAAVVRQGIVAAEKVVDDLLVAIAGREKPKVHGAYPAFLERRELVDKFKEQIEAVKKAVPVQAKVVSAFLPLMDLAWGGINPEQIAGTVLSSSAAALEVTSEVVKALEKDGAKTKAAGVLKDATELAHKLHKIVDGVKELTKG